MALFTSSCVHSRIILFFSFHRNNLQLTNNIRIYPLVFIFHVSCASFPCFFFPHFFSDRNARFFTTQRHIFWLFHITATRMHFRTTMGSFFYCNIHYLLEKFHFVSFAPSYVQDNFFRCMNTRKSFFLSSFRRMKKSELAPVWLEISPDLYSRKHHNDSSMYSHVFLLEVSWILMHQSSRWKFIFVVATS